MEMCDVRASAANDFGQLFVSLLRPCTIDGESQAASQRRVIDVIVEALECDHLHPVSLEQRPLVAKHRILATRGTGTIIVVGKQDFHWGMAGRGAAQFANLACFLTGVTNRIFASPGFRARENRSRSDGANIDLFAMVAGASCSSVITEAR